MAYIIGIVTPEEKAELERRGWEIEEPPAPLNRMKFMKPNDENEMIMIFVDSNLFDIMDGPDWEKG